jgi:hypothetical protein
MMEVMVLTAVIMVRIRVSFAFSITTALVEAVITSHHRRHRPCRCKCSGQQGSNSSYNNCVAGYGAAGAATGAGISLVGTAGAGSLIGPEGTAAGLVINQLGLAALGTYAGQKAGQFIGSIVCSAGTGGSGGGDPDATTHGAQRLNERGFSPEDVANTKTGEIKTQADGAKVYIKSVGNGRFNVIVEGDRGVITALKNISQKALDRLAANYGWH